MSHDARLEDLVILQGEEVSNAITNHVGVENTVDFLIYGGKNMLGAVNVQVSPEQKPTEDDWYDFQWSSGTDVMLTAGKAVRVAARCIKAIRLKALTQQVEDVVCPAISQQDT